MVKDEWWNSVVPEILTMRVGVVILISVAWIAGAGWRAIIYFSILSSFRSQNLVILLLTYIPRCLLLTMR